MFSGGESVEVVELVGKRVVFLGRRRLPLGKPCWVRMALRDDEGWLHLQAVPVVLEQERSVAEGQSAYVGSLRLEQNLQPLYSAQSAPAGVRRQLRYPCHLPVRAPELGPEAAWALDFSLSGLQISCAQVLQPGTTVHLHLHTPGSALQSLPLNARVAWAQLHEEDCRAGLEFRDPPPYLQKELRQLCSQLSQGSR